MNWLLIPVLFIHGLITLLGAVSAFGIAEVSGLSETIGPGMGALWLAAGILLVTAAVMAWLAPRIWWVAGLAGVVLSQVAIFSAWADARFGTIANALVALFVLRAFAAEGPLGLRSEYRRLVTTHLSRGHSAPTVTESDLEALPEAIRRYLRATGSVGRPVARHFRATIRGRIRSTPDDSWMPFTAEQHNFLSDPSRFFLMDARRGGLPVDVLHTFRSGTARMRVRLLSLLPLVNARGPDLDKAETVTVFNDLCIFAPSALIDPAIRWEPMGDGAVRGHYTVGKNTVSAVLHFNERGELADFVSDDRLFASGGDEGLVPCRWSTPLGAYRDFAGRRAFSRGEGRWHPETGEYSYLELELVDLQVNEGTPARERNAGS